MTHHKTKKLLVLATLTAGIFAAGCELIVDFDRTKIPVEVTEASVVDSSPPPEASAPVDGSIEAGADATADATADSAAPSDAGSDADADAS